MYVPALPVRRPIGSEDGPRPFRWEIDVKERGTIWLAHDDTEYELPLAPVGNVRGSPAWRVQCPTCAKVTTKLWLAPNRHHFQCGKCARVETAHRLADEYLTDVGSIVHRIQELRKRHNPVRGRYERTVGWYRMHARIVLLEDKLLELAGQLANPPRN